MNNSINNNLSFRANLVTTLKGNKNIMQPIAEEFAKITRKTSGDFFIERAAEPAKAKLKEFKYNNTNIVTTLMNKDFAQDPEQIGKKGIKAIARKLADLFYTLKAENTYKSNVDSCAENILDLKQRINKLTKLKTSSEKMGLHSLTERYDKTIGECKKGIEKNKANITKAQQNFITTLDKYPNNEVVALQGSVVSEDFAYDLNWALQTAKLKRRKK